MKGSSHLQALAALSLGKSPIYPLDMELDGSHGSFGHCEAEKNRSPAGNQTPANQVTKSMEQTQSLDAIICSEIVILKTVTIFLAYALIPRHSTSQAFQVQRGY
jgi:hypothetical protein